jgi:hypothetical protein
MKSEMLMNKGKPKTTEARTLKSAALAVALLLHLVALFDAEGLKTWAERLKDERAQAILLPPLEAWYDFSRAVGAAGVRDFIRDSLFAPVREARFPAEAAAAPSPAPPPSPEAKPPVPVYSPEHPLDVLVLGDSLAGLALPPMFNQAVARDKSIRIAYEAHNASSIAKPVYFNWPEEIKRMFAAQLEKNGKPFDLAVVVLGSNDAQTIVSGGRYLAFGSDGWNEVFRERATEFMTILSSGCGRVYWCGVPPMRKEGYRDNMIALNGLYRELALGFPNYRYVPLDFLGDENGRYVQAKVIDKVEREIRAADGVHLAYPGAELLVNRLIGLIDLDFEFARPEDRPAASNVAP